jgi:predicted transcriptional regulator
MRTSNKKSKFLKKPFYLMILSCIQEGQNYLAQIARQLDKSPQLVQHYVRNLTKYGYIQPVTGKKRSYPVIYVLTGKAKILISNAERIRRSGGIRFHRYALKYRIVTDNPAFLPLSRAGKPLKGNVLEVTETVEGHTVRRWHTPSGDWLYIWSQHMYGLLPWQLQALATIDVDRLAAFIEQRFRLRLQFEEILQKGEFDDPRDPVAKVWGEYYNLNVKTDSGSGFDASGGEWAKELSYQDAVDYVQMGRNVARIIGELQAQRKLFERFIEALTKYGTDSQPEHNPPDSHLWS